MTITLGTRYQDSITEVAGVATARTEHLDGSVRVQLERVEQDGKPGQHWFSECRLRQVEDGKLNGVEVGNGRYA